MATESRTQQATPRRRRKAREQGQVARSHELPAALVVLTVALLLWWQPQAWREEWRQLFSHMMSAATTGDLGRNAGILHWTGWMVASWVAPALLLAWLVAVVSTVAQGGFVFSSAPLTPTWGRLNPAENLKQLFSLDGLRRLLKTLVPTAFILYLSTAIILREWNQIVFASRVGVRGSFSAMLDLAFEISWKAALVLLLWSGVDYILQRVNFERRLRMSRQEIEQETRESEGHPVVRRRIRRLQRELRRRRMAAAVGQASVVVTNPHEYAVALAYEPETMTAPVVVAKGRNALAQETKKVAHWRGIPLVENRPLARRLYRAVEVGRPIPAQFYASVAGLMAANTGPHARQGSPQAPGCWMCSWQTAFPRRHCLYTPPSASYGQHGCLSFSPCAYCSRSSE